MAYVVVQVQKEYSCAIGLFQILVWKTHILGHFREIGEVVVHVGYGEFFNTGGRGFEPEIVSGHLAGITELNGMVQFVSRSDANSLVEFFCV